MVSRSCTTSESTTWHKYIILRKSEAALRSNIGKGAAIGGVCGCFLATLAVGVLTQSNLSGLVGLITGLPLGTAAGIIAAVARLRDRNRIDTAIWIGVAVALIALVGLVAVIMIANVKNS